MINQLHLIDASVDLRGRIWTVASFSLFAWFDSELFPVYTCALITQYLIVRFRSKKLLVRNCVINIACISIHCTALSTMPFVQEFDFPLAFLRYFPSTRVTITVTISGWNNIHCRFYFYYVPT